MSAEAFERLAITEVAPGYVRATITNPPINLFDPDLYAALRVLLDRMENDDGLKVVVFDSAVPEYFIAHLDVDRLDEIPDRPGAASLPEQWPADVHRLALAPVVSIVSTRGRTRGIGHEFALACDLRFASREKALFAQPEVGFGVVPGGGGLDWLPRVVGRSRALEIAIGADDIDAVTAQRWGLVNRALPDGDLDAHVDRLARRVAGFPRSAIATAKRLVNARSLIPTETELSESFRAIGDAIADPEAQRRMAVLRAAGWGSGTDVERDHPALVANLADPTYIGPGADGR